MEFRNQMDGLKNTILGLLPKEGHGQLPYIIHHKCRSALGRDVSWGEMQFAFSELYEETRIYPRQKFSESIIRRVKRY